MRPVLMALSGGDEWHVRDIRDRLGNDLMLTPEELSKRLPSGDLTFRNRVGWACSYLFHTRLIERPRRGVYRITDRGRAVLAQHPERVDLAVLSQFEELSLLRAGRQQPGIPQDSPGGSGAVATPTEEIDAAYEQLRSALIADLLEQIAMQPADFFEVLVLDLLTAMGYGGNREDAARHIGQSGDEGIDGVIQEDRLGLDQIYVQAKRWQNSVGRPDIQRFVGALQGQRASKGVFITHIDVHS